MSRFAAPSSELVQEAIRRIPTVQLRRVFYEGNNNPEWVRPLAEAGAFRNPPEPVEGEDGYVRELYWPEIDYLTRMARLAPNDVVDVLLTLRESGNSWVRRAVFEVGAAIPAEQAARLAPMVLGWGAGGLGWRSDPRSQVSMLVNLLRAGETKLGLRLANVLFQPKAAEGRKIAVGLGDHWYEEGLPRVIGVLGPAGLRTVRSWLEDYERLSGAVAEGRDWSYLRRSTIQRRDFSYSSIEHALIDAVRDLAVQGMLSDPETAAETLARRPILLFRRIVLFAAAEAIRRASEQRVDIARIVSTARTLLLDESSSDPACRAEFAELAREIRAFAADQIPELPGLIEAGPCGSSETLCERLRRDGEDDESLAERAEQYAERWRHQVLAAIGSALLPQELREVLERLDENFGEIETPLSPDITFSMWSGPTSPTSQDELSAMDPAELAAHLESWRAGTDPREPTHEGLGRELTTLISTKPRALAGIADLAERLRPTYLRCLLSGWEAAIKSGIEPEWDQLVVVIRSVLSSTGPSPFPPEGSIDSDDHNYGYAKDAAIGLLEEVSKNNADGIVPEVAMERLAEILIESTRDEEAWSSYAQADAGDRDALTLSLNWRWPISVRGLVNLLTHGPEAPWYEDALAALERELGRPDEHGASRAVVGESLGKLFLHARPWLEAHQDELFGNAEGLSAGQQIALTTALATHGYHFLFFDLLRGPLSAAIRSGESVAMGWNTQLGPSETVGQWVVYAIVFGHIDPDDRLAVEFFSSAPPNIRASVVGHTAWQFGRAEAVDKELTQRLGELWDRRLAHVRERPEDSAELADFYWFVESGKFPPDWWLPRLIEVTTLYGEFNTHGMVGESLGRTAPAHPQESLDALRALLCSDDGSDVGTYDLLEYAAAPVIAAGLASADEGLKKEALELMNLLGARGSVDLDRKVGEILDRGPGPQEQ